jgi:hypothetical protein
LLRLFFRSINPSLPRQPSRRPSFHFKIPTRSPSIAILNMYSKLVALALASSGASAVVLPRGDGCCFQVTASGGKSGTVGQLSDGQNRIGGSFAPATYCINNGGITDANGRGCILTPPSTQFQCDVGAAPTTGFSISSEGQIQYNGSGKFYACGATATEYNIYTTPVKDQKNCVEVSLSSGGKCSGNGNGNGGGSSSPTSMPASEQPTTSAKSTGSESKGSAPAPTYPAGSSIMTPPTASSSPAKPTESKPESSAPLSTHSASSSAITPPVVSSPPATPTESKPASSVMSTPDSQVPSASTKASSMPSSPIKMTTSTVYRTTVSTITSCAATVKDCPAESQTTAVVTKTIAISTTVCPVTEETHAPSAPAPGPSSNAPGSSSPAMPSKLTVPSEKTQTPTAPASGPSSKAPGSSPPASKPSLPPSSSPPAQPSQPSVPVTNESKSLPPASAIPSSGVPQGSPAVCQPITVTVTVTKEGPPSSAPIVAPSSSQQSTSNAAPSASASQPPQQQTSGAVPSAPAGSAASGSACQTSLVGAYETPHLIVPISSEHPNEAYGTSYNGEINSTVSSIFNFDIPQDYKGKQCSIVFLFPKKQDLTTASYDFNGSGSLSCAELSGPVNQKTSYSNAPSVKKDLGSVALQPGNSYVIATGECQAGTTQSIELSSMNGLSLSFFEDYNPSPLGLYITSC